MGVAEDLHLDVARLGQVALEVGLGAPEVRLRLATRRLERAGRAVGFVDDLESLAATAVRGLDRHRPSELFAERDDFGHVVDGLGGSRHGGDIGGRGGFARRDLVAHDVDRLWRWANPRDARVANRAANSAFSAKKPYPG